MSTGVEQGLQSVIPARSRISRARRARLNSDAQEVVELTQILHSKLLLQRGDDTRKQLLTGGCEHNVIDIEQQIGSLIPSAVDEERRVRLGLGEPQCQARTWRTENTKPEEPASDHRETC